MKFKTVFIYELEGKTVKAEGQQDDCFSLEVMKNAERVKVVLNAKKNIKIKKFALKFDYKFYNNNRIFINGYQSWTDSREYYAYDKMDGLKRITDVLINSSVLKKTGLNRAGDETFYRFPYKNGVFYGFSYGYVCDEDQYRLWGSLNERSGYTIIQFDANTNSVLVEKELEGVVFSGSRELLDLAVLQGGYEDVFDRYFALMEVQCRTQNRMCGYTTWYNYYRNITEKIVRRDLEALSSLEKKVDIFQIDDGYQAAIGDWLITDSEKFPAGMKSIADDIHKKGMLAGLWLAPFAVTRRSRVYKEHKDWLVKDEKGKPFICGPNWGTFYALDIYNEDAREYIRHFFDVILHQWNYDMVKLDFLYAACLLPMYNKTRGEIMCDAMDFLRECCGDKLILGCGVPLMPAFGKVDFCRIGADVDLKWKPKEFTHREDVSTPHAVNNTIFRRHLDGRAFMNDPDVFLLRDYNIDMDFSQRKLLANINSLFGSLLFVSDNVADYNEAQQKAFYETAFSGKAKILSAMYTDEKEITVQYERNGTRDTIRFCPDSGQVLS